MEPEKKMSKSDDNQNAFISLLDTPDDILRKCKRAVTDSGSEVKRAPGKAGINNLMDIYALCTGCNDAQIETEFSGKGYGAFKMAVGEAIVATLQPIQEKFPRVDGR